ncbi:DNA cytosine methyltransferase [Paenibacillus sp. AK121]|uniref:DNA cytosine methyltransferase n=1 Tax=Paenibacillus sp. AK121 TaxID=2849670 RepID=UPI001C233BBA|nr:DNA cytosine methyltransferase [Paenibacillus sp. AK121]MBU9705896.1 DNA cytosine methyltransferase [Paenibacillus sp. AK121]
MIANHDPKLLSDHVARKLAEGGYVDYIRKHPIVTFDQPSPAVLTQWAKGAPNGLVNPQGKERSVNNTENHVTYPLTQAQHEHSKKHLIGYNDSYEKPARIVRAKAENIIDGPERKETVSIRNYNVTPQLPTNGLTVAELFCGGGLMAVGLKSAGYTLTFANDFDKRAVQAYAHNIGDHVVYGDITSDDIQAQIPDADIIAGGPPCQDYSVAGSGAGEEGERGKLVWTYLGVIARKQPKAFVFENVKGLVSKKHRPTFDALLAYFESINYSVSWRVINAWDYGVAQKRERVIAVGIRKDLGFTFEFPEPSAEEYRTQVLRDVIGDLPEPKAQNNGDKHCEINHINIKNERQTRNEQSSYNGAKLEYAIQPLDQPSNTVTEKARGGDYLCHPQPRRFTVRECLRIQSVPDWYVLPSDISLSAQYRIVGNGVASRVSYLIGVALEEQLNAVLAQDLQEAA